MRYPTGLRNLIIVLPAILFAGCSSREIGLSADVNQQTIWQHYSINYTEGNNEVEVFSQFRFAGEDGTTLILSKPASITFDGTTINADSSGFSGAFYKLYKPATAFLGNHHFVYTDINGKQYANSFSLDSFRLVNLPASIARDRPASIGYVLSAPLKAADYIEIVSDNTDSSFAVTHHFNEGDKIIIPQNELMRQKGNSLTIIATLYRKEPLQQKTNEGGEVRITHTVKPVSIKLE